MKRTLESEFDGSLYSNSLKRLLETDKHWEDTSWHNDTCPSFSNEFVGLRLWVEANDVEQREYDDMSKYSLVTINEDFEQIEVILETENLDEVIAKVNEIVKEASISAMQDADNQLEGYAQ